MNLELRIDKARWWALAQCPFYGALSMHLQDVITDSIPTAATNGMEILWNPEFCGGLTDEELRFVLLHETAHCAHLHLFRLPHDTNGNIAADYVINSVILKDIPNIKMPEDGLTCPPQYLKMAEEEIYRKLPPPKKQDEEGAAACGSFTKPKDKNGKAEKGKDGKAQKESLKEKWEKLTAQAEMTAKLTKGDISAEMQRMLANMRVQQVDWRQEMSNFIKDSVAYRNDWSRSSRRHVMQPVIYPRRQSQGQIGLVVFARDTSGSISNDICAMFSSHITSAMADTGCRGLLIDCDSRIKQEVWLNPGEPCPLTAKGGGGTSHKPIWKRLEELTNEGEKVCGVVALTDLETSFPPNDGGYATLWVSTNKGMNGPFGQTVQI